MVPHVRGELLKKLQPLRVKDCPFINLRIHCRSMGCRSKGRLRAASVGIEFYLANIGLLAKLDPNVRALAR
jgi:hypothetical protein